MMKVYEVIVDELPKSCKECARFGMAYMCLAKAKNLEKEWKTKRATFCPLKLKAWKG
jgi:hypothetical protein